MLFDDVVVILCRPEDSGNVGAVCRAMKNMGFSSLRIVAPEVPLEEEKIQTRAIHAFDVYQGARFFNSLAEAIQDIPLVIGTTRRRGKKRKDISVTPEELALYLYEQPGPAALVFGNERAGLNQEEIALCTLASHIPSSELFPSLNLSHAVQVYTYELFKTWSKLVTVHSAGQQARPGASTVFPFDTSSGSQWVPVGRRDIDETVQIMTDALASIGFYKQAGRPEQERFFRDILSRAGVTLQEKRYLEQIFRKIGRLGSKSSSARPDES
ncbi:MAG TPA: RNA methyltransferase [Termitinemataceae bacterium]|nr:RNA methyltransferase [Termitinemataceae bacterium]HOM23206.1 RNA methyltransferase [Termitinemataceae bacterium]HPQ00392.1 RNA methyltransferase [Termitinemataceae bacterium]